jgi:hypothetical protein
MRGAEEREVGRRPAREEACSVPIRVDEVEYVYIYWTTCWVGLDHWALLGWAAWLHCIFLYFKKIINISAYHIALQNVVSPYPYPPDTDTRICIRAG